jgi:hypothetical protein
MSSPTYHSASATIVFTHGGGRFANQLFNYSHLLAFVMEHQVENVDFINIAFWEYAHLLETTSRNPLCRWQSNSPGYQGIKLFHFIFKVLKVKNFDTLKRLFIFFLYLYGGNPLSQYYGAWAITTEVRDFLTAQKRPKIDLASPQDAASILATKLTFLSGWDICNWDLVKKYEREIKSYLQINQKYRDIGQGFVNEQRDKYDFLIGVMIRYGDYRTWGNGRYFFTIEQYAAWMNRAAELFADKGRIGFIIASDEPQRLADFPGLNVHFTTGIAGAEGHFIESIVELSLCDVMVTTLSTFAMWAAFLGEVPILPLYNSSQEISMDDLLENHIYGMLGNPGFL